MYTKNSSLGFLGCYLVPVMCLSCLCPSLSFPQLRHFRLYVCLVTCSSSHVSVCVSCLSPSRPLLCLSLSLIPWSAFRPLFVPRSLSLCCLCFVCMCPSVCVSHSSCFSLSVSCPVRVPCSSVFPPLVCLPLCVFMSLSPSVMRRNLSHSLAVFSACPCSS